MNLFEFNYPKQDEISIACSTENTIPELLTEAHARGFTGHSQSPYEKLFDELFFSGGRVKFRSDIPRENIAKIWPYCRALMASYFPKHEDKTAVCAMLMSEILEPKTETT